MAAEVSEGVGEPSKKDTKYDRQLRLWGARGQKALAESKILLFNAGPTGTELLKNLVLPGAGHFTIVDNKTITERDLANNFFVKRDCLGQPRAKVAAELLSELNPDATGEYKTMAPEALVHNQPGYLATFNLIIATQLDHTTLMALAAVAWDRAIPLLVARSYGLIGYIRLQLREHHIVDAKVGEELRGYYNLSLSDSLPEVRALADQLDLTDMPHAQLSKIPYVLLLLKARELWHKKHGEAVPKTSSEKKAFVELLKGMAVDAGDDNFAEALKLSYLAYKPVELPQETEEVLADGRADDLTAETDDFWVVVRAIRGFKAGEGQGRLPLSGSIPDMASSTDNFTALQLRYRAKGQADRAAVAKRVGDLLESVGRARDSIPSEDIELFTKNAFSLQAMRTRSLAEEYKSPDLDAVQGAMEDAMDFPSQDMNPILWYMGLRAVDKFHVRRGHYPGVKDDNLTADEDELWEDLQQVAHELVVRANGEAAAANGDDDGMAAMDVEHALRKDHAVEMARYGAAELHNIAAVLGGIGAQEAVKVLTQQFVPVDHTYVYNGIASVGARYAI